ncbi:MAG: hypothetical protein IPP83_06775 [Flavobacteriales bacterium]|nr:hypothetical protein [Flavobacteriales bacterium]
MERGYRHNGTAAVLKMALVVAFVAVLAPSARCQLQQIQAVVDGITSPQHAAEINAVLAAQPDVVMSRTDMHTKNLLIHAMPECTLDAVAINTLIQPLGASVRCFQRERLVPGHFKHLDPQACGSSPTPNR